MIYYAGNKKLFHTLCRNLHILEDEVVSNLEKEAYRDEHNRSEYVLCSGSSVLQGLCKADEKLWTETGILPAFYYGQILMAGGCGLH